MLKTKPRPKAKTATQLRDEGLAQVMRKRWVSDGLDFIRKIALGYKGNPEQIREILLIMGLPEPHHPNAWGALIRSARTQNLLQLTSERELGKRPESHAREIKVWLRV